MTNLLQAIDDAIMALRYYADGADDGDDINTEIAQEALTNLKAAREALDSEEMVKKVASAIEDAEAEEWRMASWLDTEGQRQAQAAINAIKGEHDDRA